MSPPPRLPKSFSSLVDPRDKEAMKLVLRQFQRFHQELHANRLQRRMANGVTKTLLLNSMQNSEHILQICRDVAPLHDECGVCIDDDEPIKKDWLTVRNCLSNQWYYITLRAKKLQQQKYKLDHMVHKERWSTIHDNSTASQETNSTGSYESLESLDFGGSSSSVVEGERVRLDKGCPLSDQIDNKTGDCTSALKREAEQSHEASIGIRQTLVESRYSDDGTNVSTPISPNVPTPFHSPAATEDQATFSCPSTDTVDNYECFSSSSSVTGEAHQATTGAESQMQIHNGGDTLADMVPECTEQWSQPYSRRSETYALLGPELVGHRVRLDN